MQTDTRGRRTETGAAKVVWSVVAMQLVMSVDTTLGLVRHGSEKHEFV